MNSDSKTLCELHAYSHVLITADEHNITDRSIARQLNQVGNDQRIDAFLLPGGVDESLCRPRQPHAGGAATGSRLSQRSRSGQSGIVSYRDLAL
jgi:hypothetical protein